MESYSWYLLITLVVYILHYIKNVLLLHTFYFEKSLYYNGWFLLPVLIYSN